MILSEGTKRQIAQITKRVALRLGEVRQIGCVRITRIENCERTMQGRGWTLRYTLFLNQDSTITAYSFFGDDNRSQERFEEDFITVLLSL